MAEGSPAQHSAELSACCPLCARSGCAAGLTAPTLRGGLCRVWLPELWQHPHTQAAAAGPHLGDSGGYTAWKGEDEQEVGNETCCEPDAQA